jgi:hypothetical protein
MARYVQLARPQRRAPLARRVLRNAVVRPIVRPALRRFEPPNPDALSFLAEIQDSPYVDYSRRLTAEGGILIIYKDLDTRFRFILFRALAWMTFAGLEGHLLLYDSPVQAGWINILCLLAMAALNLLIVWKLPELYRSIEIRADCMIIEGSDVFWLSRMETGWPAFKPDKKGNQVLSGIYGTRFVEYLTVRRFDDYDRTPEVFAAHLQEAMLQLWAPPEASWPRQGGSPRWQG